MDIGFFITPNSKGWVFVKEQWPPTILRENDTELVCWDIPAYEDYDRLRPLLYSGVDLIVLCAAVDDKQSLNAITERVSWIISSFDCEVCN